MRPRSNAERRDASPVECRGCCTAGCQACARSTLTLASACSTVGLRERPPRVRRGARAASTSAAGSTSRYVRWLAHRLVGVDARRRGGHSGLRSASASRYTALQPQPAAASRRTARCAAAAGAAGPIRSRTGRRPACARSTLTLVSACSKSRPMPACMTAWARPCSRRAHRVRRSLVQRHTAVGQIPAGQGISREMVDASLHRAVEHMTFAGNDDNAGLAG